MTSPETLDILYIKTEYQAVKERSRCTLATERDIPWAERSPAKGTLKVALEPAGRNRSRSDRVCPLQRE